MGQGVESVRKFVRARSCMASRRKLISITSAVVFLLLFNITCSGRRPDPIESSIYKAVHGLQPGRIAFVVPANMKMNETKVVELRIAKKLDQDIAHGLAAMGHVAIEEIKVGPLMAATLHGSTFQITPLTKEEQAIADDSFTVWNWEIRPLDWGKQTLYLNVCARLLLQNAKEERRCSSVYQRDISIEVAPMYAATHFIKNNLAWTFSTVGSVISAFVACVAWIRKRRKK